jgi:hypothetical protein
MSGPLSGASTDIAPGVTGTNSGGGVGVFGTSNAGNAIYGNSDSGNGVYGTSASGKAAYFQGDVTITRDVTAVNAVLSGNLTADDVLLSGKDCAEEFATANRGALEPGTVVVINGEGRVCQTAEPYNKRVAGVISGAGDFRPAVVLGHDASSGEGTAPVALMGRVYCKVDASYCPIEVGDMLTTSATSGYAMRASDPARAFGAVMGKALASVNHGRDLIPILVTLQ